MKQEVPKPLLVIAAVLGVIVIGFLIFKGLKAGEPNIDPEQDKKTADYLGSVRAAGSDAAPGAAPPPGSEQAARQGSGNGPR